MADNKTASHDCAAIARALLAYGEVEAALLFGSRATGANTPKSDFDVAVLLNTPASSHNRNDVLRKLIGALAGEFSAERLDLVILNDAPNLLAFNILKDGIVAFERSPEPLHRFRVRTYCVHADYEPTERFFRNVTKARLRPEVPRG